MNALKKERTKEQIDNIKKNIGGLVTDAAATVLDLIGIPAPDDMDSKSLLPALYSQ
jgi:bisphosphoglycerate-independent phosphoglycerate mutase (AlkP superfamily)